MARSLLGQISGFRRNPDDAPSVTRSERRRSPRTVLTNLAYIHLEPDSGAIVLNVSEGGLGFHAVAPVRQTGIIRFWLSMKPDERVEASAEVAWTDESKKVGGLRFTHLSEGAQEQIQKWLGQEGTTLRPGGSKAAAPPEEVFEYFPKLSSPGVPGHQQSPDELESARAYFDLTASRMADETQPGSGAVPSLLWQDAISERPSRRSQPRFIRGFAAGVLVSVILALVFLGYGHRGQVNNLLAAFAQKAPAPPQSETVATQAPPTPAASQNSSPPAAAPSPIAPAETSPASPPAAPAPSDSEAQPTTRDASPQASAPVSAAPNSSPPLASATPADDDSSETDMAAAERYLQGSGGRKNTAAAIGFLWAAIEKGNTSAEIVLADLYARGDGVPKNCAQARVLLLAAAGKGNLEARERLQELNGKSCF